MLFCLCSTMEILDASSSKLDLNIVILPTYQLLLLKEPFQDIFKKFDIDWIFINRLKYSIPQWQIRINIILQNQLINDFKIIFYKFIFLLFNLLQINFINKKNSMSRTQFLKKIKRNKQNSLKLCIKTEEQSGVACYHDFTALKIYSPTNQSIKNQKPFLYNTKIHFNIRSNRLHLTNRHNYSSSAHENTLAEKETNIEKLKRQILQLQNEDFTSFRTKNYVIDQVKLVQNSRINTYNQQNSMIVEWKGKSQNKSETLKKPIVCHTCVPKKYYSKPKTRKKDNHSMILLGDSVVYGNQNQNSKNQKSSIKNENMGNITLGLNLPRPKTNNKILRKRNISINNFCR